jgi:tRNA A37 threonylcarbamoyladenosine synthetase subunit TsaC/SUA5/YrdC
LRSDPVIAATPCAEDVERDARRVFDVVRGGGVALIPLDVAYALVAATPQAVRRIYAAKGRDLSKPMGLVGGLPAHAALHVLDERRRAMVHAIVVEHDLPLSVVARYRPDHAYVQRLDPFVLRQCTLEGTLNLLLNAGSLRTRLADLCWEHSEPMVGTSANLSLTGSRYRVEEVDPAIHGICDLVIDYGQSRHHNAAGLSSTIIHFDELRVVRAGVCFERIHAVLSQKFGLRLADGALGDFPYT